MCKLVPLFLLTLVIGCVNTTINNEEETTVPVTVWTECDRVLDPLPVLFVDRFPLVRQETSMQQGVTWLSEGVHLFEVSDIRIVSLSQTTRITEVVGIEITCGIDISGMYNMYNLSCDDPERELLVAGIEITVYSTENEILLDVTGPNFQEVGYSLEVDLATLDIIELEIDVESGWIIRHGESRSDSGYYCPT